MKRKKGFTIVELLTVMGVIAVLIGLMVPALALVKDYSKRIQQKSQFHGIDMGLQMYTTELGSFPRSDDNSLIVPAPADPSGYCGANKLAEALVGSDLIGFHPNSDFRSDGTNDVPDTINGGTQLVNVYNTQGTAGWQTGQENIDVRKGPFVELENANAFRIDEVYAAAPGAPFAANFATFDAQGNAVTLYPLVLCDVYAQKRSGTGSKKTGTPILYFRARTQYSQQNYSIDTDYTDDIYNYDDNVNLLSLGMPNDGTAFTVEAGGIGPLENFENM
ncbi:MAG: type II secretion system protein, partial [Planctomycetota bacterium]